jgi:hypothetical protein
MGISNKLTEQLDGIFNKWAKVRITDQQVQRLIQLAMIPNKEVMENVKTGNLDELSTVFQNACNSVFEYATSSPTQQTETTKGTVFGAYNAVTGYFQNVRNFKNDEAKIKSLLFGGTGQLRSQRAFTLCEEFANRGEDALMLN